MYHNNISDIYKGVIIIIKFFKDNQHLKNSIYLLMVVIFSIIFYRITEDMNISDFFPAVLSVLSPFIYGVIIAYILNSGVRFVENKIFLKLKPLKSRHHTARCLAICTTFIFLLGVVIWIIAYIIPELMSSAQNLVNFVISFDLNTIEKYILEFIDKYDITISQETYKTIVDSLDTVFNTVLNSVKYIPTMLNSLLTHAISILGSVFDLVMGIVIAFYILSDKEKIVEIAEKSLFSMFSAKKSREIIYVAKYSNNVFERFFVGKTIDSFIIAIIFFLGALVLNLPYPLLLSLIIGVTNMIPYFGPFIGAVPVSILTLLVSPIKCIWVVIFIIILQQFDGIILGPKILGNSIGLKPIGVIFAIIVGGAIAGPLGMFFGVPVFAVMFTALLNNIEHRYRTKINKSRED